jgi:hypothetical protein
MNSTLPLPNDFASDTFSLNDEIKAKLRKSADFRVECLRQGLAMAGKGVLLAAHAVAEMERAGDPLPEMVGQHMLSVLRKIAAGQTLPEVAVNYKATPLLADTIANYAIADQQKLVDETPIPVVVTGEDGRYTHRLMKPGQLFGGLAKQVFSKDGIRSEQEQTVWLEEQKQRATIRKAPKMQVDVRVDKKRGGIVVTGDSMLIPAADLARYLAQLNS